MKIFHGLSELGPQGRVVATIGNFDGVHRGHQWVIAEVRARAAELEARSLAITFDPHPSRVLRPERATPMITPLRRKLELLAETGIEGTLVLPFVPELYRMSAREFARRVLVEAVGAVEVHEGENFRFGFGAEAGVDGLQALGRELRFGVKVYAPRMVRGGAVSSSRVRELIAAGEMNQARGLLGRAFLVESTPASGRGFGTRYTVPTINLAAYDDLLPGNGVYVTTMTVGAERFDGVTNVGNRPTFGADSFTVETHLLDFHAVELSATTELTLTFYKRLRGEKRWPTPEALRAQIGVDVGRARRFFSLCRARQRREGVAQGEMQERVEREG